MTYFILEIKKNNDVVSSNSREFLYFRHKFDVYTLLIFNIDADMTVSVSVDFGKHSKLYHYNTNTPPVNLFQAHFNISPENIRRLLGSLMFLMFSGGIER